MDVNIYQQAKSDFLYLSTFHPNILSSVFTTLNGMLKQEYLWRTPYVLVETKTSYTDSFGMIAEYLYPGKILHAYIKKYLSIIQTDCQNHPIHGLIWRRDVNGLSIKLHALKNNKEKKEDCVCGQSMLILAVLLDIPEAVEVILQCCTASVRDMNIFGQTALHWSFILEHQNYCKVLILKGGDLKKIDIFGAVPEDYANIFYIKEKKEDLNICVYDKQNRLSVFKDNTSFFDALGFIYSSEGVYSLDCVFSWVKLFFDIEKQKKCLDRVVKIPCFLRTDFNRAPLYLRYIGDHVGYGVFSADTIKEGDVVTTYACPVLHWFHITIEELCYLKKKNIQGRYYNSRTVGNIFEWSFSGYRMGDFGTRINSSQNKETENLSVCNLFWRGMPMQVFLAKRCILPGEQLLWYYGTGYWENRLGELRDLSQNSEVS